MVLRLLVRRLWLVVQRSLPRLLGQAVRLVRPEEVARNLPLLVARRVSVGRPEEERAAGRLALRRRPQVTAVGAPQIEAEVLPEAVARRREIPRLMTAALVAGLVHRVERPARQRLQLPARRLQAARQRAPPPVLRLRVVRPATHQQTVPNSRAAPVAQGGRPRSQQVARPRGVVRPVRT